jgi:preprotein translocase subunit YajC
MDGILGGQLPFIILMFLVVYLFMIRPQIQKTKKEKRFNEALKKGDKVITVGGLHAKILELNDDGTVILESGAGKMKFDRSALSMDRTERLNKETS